MNNFRILSLMASAVLVVGTLPGQAVPATADSVQLAEGRRIFEGRGLCASCHGKAGEGILGPSLKLNADKATWLHFDGSLTAAIALIKRGIPDDSTEAATPMPAAKLSDSQIAAVAAYVLHLHQRKQQ
jgi:mono/diheme cytochrome c family protein